MSPEFQMIFNIAIAIGGFLGGWWLKTMWEELKALQFADQKLVDRVSSIEVLVAGTYVTRSDLERLTDALFKKLDRIEDQLKDKADKPHG